MMPFVPMVIDEITGKPAREEAERNREAVATANEQNIDAQREFAQMGIQWRVADALKAGIHPLAAIGASGASFSPTFQAFTDDSAARRHSFVKDFVGQNLSRAMFATMTADDRAASLLRLKNMDLHNQLLEKELKSPQLGPPFPSVVEQPLERVAAEADAQWQEAGWHPGVTYMKTRTGFIPMMPTNLSEAVESDENLQRQWSIRYRGAPNIAPVEKPSKNKLPRGAVGWKWNFYMQEWQPFSASAAENMGRREMERKHAPVDRGPGGRTLDFMRRKTLKWGWR